MIHLNLVPNNCGYKCLGIYSKNCIAWVLSEFACVSYQMTIVPIYDTLGAESVELILNQTKMNCAVCAKLEMTKVSCGRSLAKLYSC